MITNIISTEKLLFNEWSKKRGKLSPDGVIDEQSYLESKPKLLFLLKEVNSDSGFDLKQFVKDGGRSQTWDNIARWIYGIRSLDKEFEWKDLEEINTNKQRQGLFKSICVMNLKKSPGGHTTHNNELWRIASEDKEFLNRQFKIYFENPLTRPELIIACGSATSNTFNELINVPDASDWKMTSRGIWYYEYDNRKDFFIQYAHPEARVQDNLLYYGLIDAVKELTTRKKSGT
jgi:hypothetical protein